jgi:hypothetical protein
MQSIGSQFSNQYVMRQAVKCLREIHQDCSNKALIIQFNFLVLKHARQNSLAAEALAESTQVRREDWLEVCGTLVRQHCRGFKSSWR